MRSVWGRTWFWVVILLAALILGIVIWLALPLRHAAVTAHAPESAIVFVHTTVDPDSEAVQLVLSEARTRLFGEDPSFWEKAAFGVGRAIVMPKRVTVWVAPGVSASEPEYLAAIDFGRGGRIIRALGARAVRQRLFNEGAVGAVSGTRVHVDWDPDEGIGPAAFAFTRDTLLVARSYDALVGAASDRAALSEMFRSDISRAVKEETGLLVVADNTSAELSQILQAAEDEFAFAIMPSADALQSVVMAARLTGGAAVGSALFSYDDIGRIEEAYSDLRYIRGVIRRLLRPRGLDMVTDIIIEGSTVRFEFTIEDFATLLRQSPEGGDGS